MTQLPMYLHGRFSAVIQGLKNLVVKLLIHFFLDTTDLNIEDVGFLSAVPYLAMAVTAQFSGIIADTLRSKYNISTTVVRPIKHS